MDARMARELCRYNRWANGQVLDVAAGLPLADLTCSLGGSFGSIQATLTHIMWAEWMWLGRWTAGSSRGHLAPGDYPTVEALRRRWQPIADEQTAFVDALTDGRLSEVVSYLNLKGETWAYPLWRQLYHVFNHSAYHRGQVTALLRQSGKQPVTTDYLNFCDAIA